MTGSAEEFGRKADDSDVLDFAVRVGLISYGVVHLLIAWLAAQLAFGHSSGSASKDGAKRKIKQGSSALKVAIYGFLLQFAEVCLERGQGWR